MRRIVGAAPAPAEFKAILGEVYHAARGISDHEMRSRFRKTRAYAAFRALLREVAPPAGARILAIGCGPRMAGRGAAYAASVVRECFPGTVVEELNLQNEVQPEASRVCHGEEPSFDLVVTHSFLHYVDELRRVCEWIGGMLRPGGRYLMANELNVRFWRNPEIVREMRRVEAAESRRSRLLNYANPRRYLAKARRALRGRHSLDAIARTNRLLHQRLDLDGDLTAREITLILEPYIDGMSWADLESGALSFMRLETVRTSGYLMREDPAHVPARWRALNENLAARYPLDGHTFSALWRQR